MAPKQIVREYIYAFTAVCPAQGKMTSLVLPWANTDMMAIFLQEVSETYQDSFIVMLVDGASWHSSKRLAISENIRLIKQPSHSPELNPVEHIWEELREKYFGNKALRSLDEVEDQLCTGLVELSNNPKRLTSMTNFPYLRNSTH